MQLDKRIKDTGSILTCFTAEDAKKYVGQKGFFADEIYAYHDLDHVDFRTLDRVDDDHVPFVVPGNLCYQFFLPAEFVRPAEEKKWRPFTLDEFLKRFPLLSPVTYREKKHSNCFTLCVTGYGCLEHGTAMVYLGGFHNGLNTLFDCYELKDKDGNWTPFGVEE